MRKVLKNLKQCVVFCLAFALVFSVPAFAADTVETAKWAPKNGSGGGTSFSETGTLFGVTGKTATKYTCTGSGKMVTGYTVKTETGTEMANDQFLIIDMNLATPDDGVTVATRTNRDVPLIKDIPLEKGVWHSARLVVEKPLLEDANNDYFAKHKLYLDGSLVGEYTQTATDTKKLDKNLDFNNEWDIRAGLQNQSVYYADLSLSYATEDPGQSVPSLAAKDSVYKTLNNKIYPTSKAGVKVSDLTCADGTVAVIATDETFKDDSALLQEGDRVLVSKNQMYHAYRYTEKTNVILDASTYENLQRATNGTVRKETGVFGKDSADESAILKNEKNGNKNTNPYFNLGSAEGKIAGMDYMVFELNVKPNENCQRVCFTSTGGGAVANNISSDALQKDCWNKIIIVVNTKANENGKYTNTIYINGTQITTAEVPKKLGDVVSSTDSRIMTDIRLNADCNTDAEAVDVAYVDDVKIYETFVAPTVLAYTVTNSANAAYDSQNAIIYAKNDDAITAACGGTVAKREVGYVIVNRGNENYSRYNVRTIESGKIGIDKTAKEFWSTADSIGTDDCFILAKYNSDNSKTTLSGAEIIKGTRIGNYVIKGNYTTETGKITKLYFWDIKTLEAKAGSESITE